MADVATRSGNVDVRVRPIEARDETRWLELFRDYITFYEATIAEDVVALTWRRLLGQSDGMIGLIAVDDQDRPLGIATLVFHRSTWSPTSYCYLEDLFVDPGVRSAGIGRELIGAAYAEADRRGATRVYWATADTNEAARRLYDKVGELTPFVQYRRPE